MIVLSLFDGISCGRVALDRANLPITTYYSSEIDRFAIQVAQKNYPDTVQLGDINKWENWDIPNPDLIIGGSPCQGFSFAGKQLAFEDSRSALFFKFVDILNHYQPKYFLLENVRMKKEYQDVITKLLDVEPVCINSALVSAQNRVRYYWTNIKNITQPENKGIVVNDILHSPGKIGRMTGRRINEQGKRDDYNHLIPVKQRFEPRKDNKSGCLTTVQKDNLIFAGEDQINAYRQRKAVYNSKGKSPTLLSATGGNHHIKIAISDDLYRNLTPIECERLQTLPDNYTEGISNTQRYKALGNAWTVDVISHLLSSI